MSSSMSNFRPKVKAQFLGDSYERAQTIGDPALRYVDISTSTPWTTTEKSWRCVSAPLLWPQELRAASPLDGQSVSDDDEDPFATERSKLKQVNMSMNKINKFYIPIAKLPPLGGLDPRSEMAKRPPSCAPNLSAPRSHKIMARWQTMPRLRSQLPAEDLHIIQATTRRHQPAAASAWRQDRDKQQHSNRNSARGPDGQPLSRREDTDARLVQAFREMEDGSARGKKEHPHIPCACCDHKVEKPWMPKTAGSLPGSGLNSKLSSTRGGPPGSGSRAPTASTAATTAATFGDTIKLGSDRARGSVAFEDNHSCASSEHWGG